MKNIFEVNVKKSTKLKPILKFKKSMAKIQYRIDF